jgi:hypothetical protein
MDRTVLVAISLTTLVAYECAYLASSIFRFLKNKIKHARPRRLLMVPQKNSSTVLMCSYRYYCCFRNTLHPTAVLRRILRQVLKNSTG